MEPQDMLILTMGLPRAGKSTWARAQGHPIVNPDSIRLAIHGKPFISEAEPYVWAVAKTMVRALFLSGHGTVIVDATNTTLKRREEWLSSKWGTAVLVFGTPEEICLQRAEAIEDDEHREGLQGAIRRMAAAWESAKEEHAWVEHHDGGYVGDLPTMGLERD